MRTMTRRTKIQLAPLTLVVFLLATGSAFGQFTEHTSFVASYDGAAIWGDYDNDQDLDFLIIGSLNTTKLYTNNGGVFSGSTIGVPSLSSSSAAWGDYDNDGDLDLLVTGSDGDPQTFLFRNSAGVFSDVTPAALPGVEHGSTAWGDFDNDGDLDILISGNSATGAITRVYRRTTRGYTDISAGLPGCNYSSVSWGDYDKDGDLDILLSGYAATGAIASVYENNAGVFTDISAGMDGLYSGFNTFGDYDADGDLDALVGGYAPVIGINTDLYHNIAGSFSDYPLSSILGIWRGDGDWGDYDNDGNLDILISGETTSYNNYSRVLYRGASGDWYSIGASLVGLDYSSVDWGDYDNDGDLDILMTGRQMNVNLVGIVYENDSAVANTPPEPPQNLELSVVGSLATFSWDAATDAETPAAGLTYNLRVGTTLYGSEICSAMADPFTGFRSIPAIGNVNHNLSWQIELPDDDPIYWSVQAIDGAYAGSAFGTMGNPPTVSHPYPAPNSLYVSSATNVSFHFSRTVAAETLNNDNIVITGSSSGLHLGSISINYGQLVNTAYINPYSDFEVGEVVTVVLTPGILSGGYLPLTSYSWSFTVRTVESQGLFDPDVTYATDPNPDDLYAADLDDDGDIDLVTANGESNSVSILRNDGSGVFSPHTEHYVGAEPKAVVAADLDGDGDQDLAVAKGTGDEVSTLLNNGAGVFTSHMEWPVGDVAYSIRAVDLDGDGDQDLVAVNAGSASVSVLWNNGDATFAAHETFPTGGLPYWVAVSDFDGDGDMDLAVASNVLDQVSILLNNGKGGFAPFSGYPTGDGPVRVVAGDLDGDGDVDLVTSNNYSNNFSVLLNRGTGVFDPPTSYPATGAWGLHCADLDGDGSLDVSVTRISGSTVYCYANDGNGAFTANGSYSVGYQPKAVVAADLDNDGDLDLAAVNNAHSTVSILLNKDSISGVNDEDETPAVTRLHPNYPNPFNPQTTLIFELAHPTRLMHLAIYDLQGSLVRTLVNEGKGAGRYEVVWNGKNESGKSVASGLYMARLVAGDVSQMRKLVLLK
jgi:FG-GAP-like repeat/FlgD Ig-like domain/Bacterial Ig-like domain